MPKRVVSRSTTAPSRSTSLLRVYRWGVSTDQSWASATGSCWLAVRVECAARSNVVSSWATMAPLDVRIVERKTAVAGGSQGLVGSVAAAAGGAAGATSGGGTKKPPGGEVRQPPPARPALRD